MIGADWFFVSANESSRVNRLAAETILIEIVRYRADFLSIERMVLPISALESTNWVYESQMSVSNDKAEILSSTLCLKSLSAYLEQLSTQY
jgi:hypothetical protein